jgi:hypothetical protein
MATASAAATASSTTSSCRLAGTGIGVHAAQVWPLFIQAYSMPREIASRTTGPAPYTTLTTPAGVPAAAVRSANRAAVRSCADLLPVERVVGLGCVDVGDAEVEPRWMARMDSAARE